MDFFPGYREYRQCAGGEWWVCTHVPSHKPTIGGTGREIVTEGFEDLIFPKLKGKELYVSKR